MRRAGGAQVGVNSKRTKRNQPAPTNIEIVENSRRPFSSGARGREFESPRSDQQILAFFDHTRTPVGGNVGELNRFWLGKLAPSAFAL